MNCIEFGFVNHIIDFLKMVLEHEIFENSFSQGKMVGLGLFTLVMIYNIFFRWESWTLTWFCFENLNSLKNGKTIRTLGNIYVFATTLICDLCV